MELWNRLRFWAALMGGKLFLAVYRKQGRLRNDRPGMVALRLYRDFLKYVAKPSLTIVVTGTNGKTSTSSLVAQLLQRQGMTVSYNDWGANHHAGVARCLLDAVSWFNRPVKDAAVIEMDELVSPEDVPYLKPRYIIITNLSRDSMLRNAYPAHIATRLRQTIHETPGAMVVLNGDDPLSCFLADGEENRRAYFGLAPVGPSQNPPLADDFAVCPRCGSTPVFAHRSRRHMGQFRCPGCGLEPKKPDYLVEKLDLDKGIITLREPDGTHVYPLPSANVHTATNVAALVPLFRDLGMSPEELAQGLREVKLPQSRESRETVRGITLQTIMAKGQNAPAVSTALANVVADPAAKEVVLLLDEHYDEPGETETIAWIHDVDFELLTHPSVHRIVLGGARYLDHQVRLRMAGIPGEKLVCLPKEEDVAEQVSLRGIEKIYILHDVNCISRSRRILERIRQRLEQEGGKDA